MITVIERMEPRHYLSASYYERSLTGFATVCIEKVSYPGKTSSDWPKDRSRCPCRARKVGTTRPSASRFKIGDEVRVKNEFVSGHVRMPGYIRGKIRIVVTASRPYPFPDAAAHNLRTQDEPAYDVRFRTDDLWPQAADETTVHVAVFQSYLEKAPRPASRKGLP